MPQGNRGQRFNHAIVAPLSMNIAMNVATRNARIAGKRDEHQAEAVVQGMMRDFLTPFMPCPSLIIENEEILKVSEKGGYIPDLIVKNVGTHESDYWGFFELKTLLKDDDLKVAEVQHDLKKLCAYKKAFPSAASVFTLVGSWKKLFHPNRTSSFERLPIRYEPALWANTPPAHQVINDEYVAIPVSACAIQDMEIACFMWEVQPKSQAHTTHSSSYDFVAEMS